MTNRLQQTIGHLEKQVLSGKSIYPFEGKICCILVVICDKNDTCISVVLCSLGEIPRLHFLMLKDLLCFINIHVTEGASYGTHCQIGNTCLCGGSTL